MYELLFSSAAGRYFKKVREKPLKAAYKAAFVKIAYTIKEVDNKKFIVLLAGTRENFYEQLTKVSRIHVDIACL